jgi:hypothetical protein
MLPESDSFALTFVRRSFLEGDASAGESAGPPFPHSRIVIAALRGT